MMHFINPALLILLWALIIPIVVFIFAVSDRRKKIAFLSLNNNQLSILRFKDWFSAALVSAFFILCTLAIAGPYWQQKEVKTKLKGRDVLFLIDVSNSMKASDVRPDRLESAKLSIREAMPVFYGNRVALAAFAGSSVIKCPLTTDYGYFTDALNDLDSDAVGLGGTDLASAIDKSVKMVFPVQEGSERDIILFTDGEDLKGNPVQVAESLNQKNIRIIVIGIGDEATGARIPILSADGQKRFLVHNGKEVWTKLDSSLLKKIASSVNGGHYINAGTATLDLGDIYKKLSLLSKKNSGTEESNMDYKNEFLLFLYLAFILLLFYVIFAEKRQ